MLLVVALAMLLFAAGWFLARWSDGDGYYGTKESRRRNRMRTLAATPRHEADIALDALLAAYSERA
jgi:hypothetical protein